MPVNSAVARFYWSQIKGSTRILDLGCGSGGFGCFAPPSVEVYGIDLNTSALEKAKEWEIVKCWDLDSSQSLPFPDEYFDAVVAKDILEHLQKPWRVVAEIKRITRVGGIVLGSVICEHGKRTWADYTHVRGFTEVSVRQLFEDSGLEVVAVWRMGPVPLSSRLRAIRLVPVLLRLPVLHWMWTSSYEIRALRTS